MSPEAGFDSQAINSPQTRKNKMTLTGKLSKKAWPNGQGSFYQLDTDDGYQLAVSMTESVKPADDDKVLGPLVGKKIKSDGIIQKSRGTLLAFTVEPL